MTSNPDRIVKILTIDPYSSIQAIAKICQLSLLSTKEEKLYAKGFSSLDVVVLEQTKTSFKSSLRIAGRKRLSGRGWGSGVAMANEPQESSRGALDASRLAEDARGPRAPSSRVEGRPFQVALPLPEPEARQTALAPGATC